jgi:hypothetical protein
VVLGNRSEFANSAGFGIAHTRRFFALHSHIPDRSCIWEIKWRQSLIPTVFGNYLVQVTAKCGIVGRGADQGAKVVQAASQYIPAHGLTSSAHHFPALGRQGVFAFVKQLLIELFATAKACVRDLNFIVSFTEQTREHSDHVNDAHRLAHLKHQDFSMPTESETLQNE